MISKVNYQLLVQSWRVVLEFRPGEDGRKQQCTNCPQEAGWKQQSTKTVRKKLAGVSNARTVRGKCARSSSVRSVAGNLAGNRSVRTVSPPESGRSSENKIEQSHVCVSYLNSCLIVKDEMAIPTNPQTDF